MHNNNCTSRVRVCRFVFAASTNVHLGQAGTLPVKLERQPDGCTYTGEMIPELGDLVLSADFSQETCSRELLYFQVFSKSLC